MRIDVHAHLWTDDSLDLLHRLGKIDVNGAEIFRLPTISQ